MTASQAGRPDRTVANVARVVEEFLNPDVFAVTSAERLLYDAQLTGVDIGGRHIQLKFIDAHSQPLKWHVEVAFLETAQNWRQALTRLLAAVDARGMLTHAYIDGSRWLQSPAASEPPPDA